MPILIDRKRTFHRTTRTPRVQFHSLSQLRQVERGRHRRWKTDEPGRGSVNFLSLLVNHLARSIVPAKPRFCVSASYTATCVTRIRKAFQLERQVKREERGESLLPAGLSPFSLYLASVRGRTDTNTHAYVYMYHVRPSYEIVFLAHGDSAVSRFKAESMFVLCCERRPPYCFEFIIFHPGCSSPAGTRRRVR